MSDYVRAQVENFVEKAGTVVPESDVFAAFHALAPSAVRAALDDLVARGNLLRWNRDDGVAAWSSIFQALSVPKGWTIETSPLDEETLQDELLALEPFSFTEFVESVLHRRRDVQKVAFSGADWNYDLVVVDAAGDTSYLITKRVRTTNERRVREALESRNEIRSKDPAANVVLVVPGVVTEKAAKLAVAEALPIWDRKVLLEKTPLEIAELYRAARRREIARDRGTELITRLASIPAGREHWNNYQGLVGRLLEFLFVPPLGVPALEISNESGADRRDLVMANTAESGIWSLFRQLYRAEYVVVDAKNYTEPLAKKPILEVAHYLKWYGPGLFALVACRHGFADAGRIAAREQWIGSQRMIVPITDEDFAEMVRLRQQRSAPEDVLVETIRRFRLSL